jgi:subtilase family serine protease
MLPRFKAIPSTLALVTALALAVTFGGAASAAPIASNASSVSFFHSCGAATAGFAQCHAIVRVGGAAQRTSANALTGCSNPSSGYTPCDLQSAYNIPSTTATTTVAIVDAYNDPNAEADLGVYRSQFGLPACTTANGCFSKVNQTGGTSYPRNDGGWAQEISLDLDMVSALCPTCHILLVEASSNSFANLLAAEDYATSHASYISNSWSGGESSSETSYDSHFEHAGKVYVFATGDSGYGTGYPAASPYVTAAGGTTLTPASNSRGWTETAWSGAGSGCSSYEAQPSWQSTVSNITSVCSKRAEADVSAVANPSTGVDVYDSFKYQGLSGWLVFGGTSVATPVITTVYAIAGNASTAVPTATSGASYIYSHTSSLNDVTSGSNGNCGTDLCNAVAGWDGPTGFGTPNGTGSF